jgi:CRP-like cAMP-binding protein
MSTRALQSQSDESSAPFAWLTDQLSQSCGTGRGKLRFGAGADVNIGDDFPSFCLLLAGWALRYVRCRSVVHIVDIVLPGDLIGLPLACAACAAHPLRCVTDVEIAPFDARAFAALVRRQPAVLDELLRLRLEEEYRSHCRTMVLATKRPTARLCHLMLDIRERLLRRSGADTRRFSFPLTYWQLADLIGASRSQIAASLSELRDRGWARVEYGSLAIEDAEQMAAACEFSANVASWYSCPAAARAAEAAPEPGGAFVLRAKGTEEDRLSLAPS